MVGDTTQSAVGESSKLSERVQRFLAENRLAIDRL